MSLPFIRQGYYPRDDDYYIILDVDYNASPETVTTAYRNLARRFHPDKHNQDERSRKEAEVIFHKIKTAYDVLGDPHKRKIYDTLGPEGLKLDGWKMIKKQMTAQEIREEYMRLQKQQMDDKNASIAKPRAALTVALDASEIFRRTSDEDDDDDDDDDDDNNLDLGKSAWIAGLINKLSSVEIRSLSTSMAVDNNLALNHNLTLSGNLNTQNGTGDGTVGLIYRYKYSQDTQYNVLYQVGRGPILSAGIDHKFNDRTSLSTRGMLIFDTYAIAPGAKITLTHKIRNYLLGKVTYREGINSSVTTSLIYVNEKLMFEVTTSYKLTRLHQAVSVDFGYRFNNNDSKVSVSLVGSSKEGLGVEYGCETRVFTINSIGAALALSVPAGITLKLRYSRANQEFNIPIYLSDEIHSAPVFYGTIVPLIAYYIVDRCYLKHHRQKEV